MLTRWERDQIMAAVRDAMRGAPVVTLPFKAGSELTGRDGRYLPRDAGQRRCPSCGGNRKPIPCYPPGRGS